MREERKIHGRVVSRVNLQCARKLADRSGQLGFGSSGEVREIKARVEEDLRFTGDFIFHRSFVIRLRDSLPMGPLTRFLGAPRDEVRNFSRALPPRQAALRRQNGGRGKEDGYYSANLIKSSSLPWRLGKYEVSLLFSAL